MYNLNFSYQHNPNYTTYFPNSITYISTIGKIYNEHKIDHIPFVVLLP